MGKGGVIYILTNKNRTTLYVGLTSDLITRLHDHQTKKYTNSFTARYNLDRLKAGKRQTKIDLIEGFNPEWKDLTEEVLKW